MAPVIVFAFPGMGKTPLAQTVPGYVDLDFGHFRESLRCSKVDQSVIIPYFVRLLRCYLQDGYSVLVNDPMVLDHLHAAERRRSVMYLPHSWERSMAKLHYTPDQMGSAIKTWSDLADYYGIPLHYLHRGLDEELTSSDAVSPTGSHCASVHRAAWRQGTGLTAASPGLRSYPVDDVDD